MRDEAYEVVPNAEVTLPDFLDWLPKSRGLPLVLGMSPVDRAPRTVPKAVPAPVKKALPDGVTSGHNAILTEPREDGPDVYEGEGEEELSPEDQSGTVAKAVEALKKQGVKVPGKR